MFVVLNTWVMPSGGGERLAVVDDVLDAHPSHQFQELEREAP